MNEGPINTPQAAVGTWTPEGETPPRPSEDDLIAACASVFDPEIPVNIYELGLIYTIDIDDAVDAGIKVFMADGEILEQGPPAELFSAPRHERLRAFISQIERH